MTINLQSHERHRAPATPSPGWQALESARAEFTLCRHYTHNDDAAEPRVCIMGAGSLGGDILDESNSAALSDLGDAWYNRDSNECRTGDNYDVEWHRDGPHVWVCVAPAMIDAELLAEIIATAEGFADYPVLDEGDNSQREMDAWDASMDWELRAWPEAIHDELRQAVAETWSGYSDPGYVAPTWVTRTARALGHTSRRVRATPYQGLTWPGHQGLALVEIMAPDGDGEPGWQPYGWLGQFGVAP